MNCVMVFARCQCARRPTSNQAVQSLGTVVTDRHLLGAFSLERQQSQKVGGYQAHVGDGQK